MPAPVRAILMALGLCLPACLDLGGSWDPTAATSATTASNSSTSTTTTTAGTTTTGAASTTMTGVSSSGGSTSGTETGSEVEECDRWLRECPEGEKCMPYANDGGGSWNAWGCFPLDPDPDGVGDSCTVVVNGLSGIDSCEEGAMCWDVVPETREGVCIAFCTGSADSPMCEPGSSCGITADATLILCIPGCDPLFQDCPADDLCLPIGGYFHCVLDASGEMGAYGDPCEYANACDPGLVCLNPEYVPDCKAGGCCSPFCDTSAPNTCPGDGQECIPWYEEGEAPEGYEHVGVCGVPQP